MSHTKPPSNDFARALKCLRLAKGLSQEDFSLVSSRTYVSSLERGIYSPTLSKIDELAEVLQVHPLALLALSYMNRSGAEAANSLIERVQRELSSITCVPAVLNLKRPKTD